MSGDQVKVLTLWASPYVMRVLIALEEKGIPYERQEENLPHSKSQLLLDSNPVYKKVPVLLHNGKSVCESLNIVQYIDEMWDSKGKNFLPEEAYDRAAARFWADYIDKKFVEALSAIVGKSTAQLRDQAKVALSDSLVTLDGAVQAAAAGGKSFFGGSNIGLVGIAFAPFTCFFRGLEVLGDFKLPDEKACPTLYAWIKELLENGSVQKCLPDPLKLLEYMKKHKEAVGGV